MRYRLKEFFTVKSITMVACVSIVVYLALIPLLILLINSFRNAPIGSPDAYFTFAHYLEAYLDPEYYYLWKNTLLMEPRHRRGGR